MNSYGYTLSATEAKNTHQGGVALFYRKAANWHVEGVKRFGPNVIGATLVSGNWRRSIIGAYIPPSETNGETLKFIQLAAHKLRKNSIILLGDLNVDLLDGARRRNPRKEATVDLIKQLDLKITSKHFLRKRKGGVWTWWQRREGRIVTATTDYILLQDEGDTTSYKLKTSRFDTDHRLVKASLKICSKKEHKRYLNKRTTFPIQVIPQSRIAMKETELLESYRRQLRPWMKKRKRTIRRERRIPGYRKSLLV